MKIGQGFDAHRFSDATGEFKIRLGGVTVPHGREVVAHSDGDVLIHALCDAMLGALALGDIGKHFPDDDPAYRNIDSLELLTATYELVRSAQHALANADLTLIAESPRIAHLIQSMRRALADALSVDDSRISIKATTTEGMGFIGRGDGLAAQAVVLLEAS